MKKELLSKSKVFRKFKKNYFKRTEPVYYTKRDIVFYKLSILLAVLGGLSLFTTIMLVIFVGMQYLFTGLCVSIFLFFVGAVCYSFPVFETIYLIIKK